MPQSSWWALAALGVLACQAGSSIGGPSPRALPPVEQVELVEPQAKPRASKLVPVVKAAPEAEPEPFSTLAPNPARAPDPALEPLLVRCGMGDAALHRAASKLLIPKLRARPLDSDSVTFAVRTSGSPYVKPRAVRLHQQASRDLAGFDASVTEWLSTLDSSPGRRCGIASSVHSESGYWLSIVSAEALADLEPLPARVERGARLSFAAKLLIPATNAELVVLGPTGPPRTVPVSLAGDQLEAGFFLDTPGVHQIQLMVDHAGGPSAAIEAWVGVGSSLPTTVDAAAVPGENIHVNPAGADPAQPERAVLDMLNAARSSEGLPALEPDPALDQLAQDHAAAMRSRGRLEHDLGDGNPIWRLQASGIRATTAGENLARAPTLGRAHRAIWASPSHRANLLDPHFDTVGIGVERGANGEWWVCELLADVR